MSQYPISLTGRLTSDPHLTKISETMYKTRFRIASSRSVPETTEEGKTIWRELDLNFIDAEVWGQCAINVKKSLSKGMPVFVMGSIVTDQWKDPQGGNRSKTYIKAGHVGLDLNRFIITSVKIGTPYGEDGAEQLWLGENPPVPDVDHTASDSAASSSEQTDPMPEALRAAEDTPQDTAADRQQAQSSAEEISEPEEVMV
ncbi:single-stranded DNA-binding protein [Corynebacterium sp. HMSC078H07]|uniref:single-stranded DNA-binding protein n=1 Tax=Corynebacterium sp. HMSC078H07 TaxID=1739379 RepID=UPI0008A308B8|nr:single-stranded DNA-binding protein [Corynebacterium sp. HMSC078H07]OFR64760.1 single-stranded DNA-binding protein [Corynebacterium sp. HMSC078H07]